VRAGAVEFRHPLIRSAIYAAAPAAERRAAHRALAAVLPDADADRRAWHQAAAAVGPDERASAALEQAGGRARARSAYAVAAAAYERAAGLSTDERRVARLLLSAADAAWLAGAAEQAVGLLADAARHPGDAGVRAEIDHLRGHIAVRQGRMAEGQRLLSAAAEAAAATDGARAVVILAEATNASFYAGDVSRISQAQIFMTHALTSSEQTVRKLLRRQMHVSLDVLEPLHRVPRRVLKTKRLGHPLSLIGFQRLLQIARR